MILNRNNNMNDLVMNDLITKILEYQEAATRCGLQLLAITKPEVKFLPRAQSFYFTPEKVIVTFIEDYYLQADEVEVSLTYLQLELTEQDWNLFLEEEKARVRLEIELREKEQTERVLAQKRKRLAELKAELGE